MSDGPRNCATLSEECGRFKNRLAGWFQGWIKKVAKNRLYENHLERWSAGAWSLVHLRVLASTTAPRGPVHWGAWGPWSTCWF